MANEERPQPDRNRLGEPEYMHATRELWDKIRAHPNDLLHRYRAGCLYYAQGETEKAGLCWLLLEPKSEKMEEAVWRYRSSVNNRAWCMLRDLQFCGDPKQLPAHAQSVLEELKRRTQTENQNMPCKETFASFDEPILIEEPMDLKGLLLLLLSIIVPLLLLIGLIKLFT